MINSLKREGIKKNEFFKKMHIVKINKLFSYLDRNLQVIIE